MGDAASYRSRSTQTNLKTLGKCRSLGCGNLGDPDYANRVEASIRGGQGGPSLGENLDRARFRLACETGVG